VFGAGAKPRCTNFQFKASKVKVTGRRKNLENDAHLS